MIFPCPAMHWSAAAGGSSAPVSLPSLLFWLEADGTLWQNSDGSVAVVSDGDPVGAWDDLWGGGFRWSQATSGKRPTYHTNVQNGKPALTFDGSNDCLTRTAINLPSGYTFAFVLYSTDVNGAAVYYLPRVPLLTDTASYIDSGLGVVSVGGVVNAAEASGNIAGSTSCADGVFHRLVITHDSGTNAVTIYRDGVSDASGTLTYDGVHFAISQLGTTYDGSTRFADMKLAAVLACGTALGSSDVAALDSYWKTKYGL